MYEDLIIIYPKPYSIYFRGIISRQGTSLWVFRLETGDVNEKACLDAQSPEVSLNMLNLTFGAKGRTFRMQKWDESCFSAFVESCVSGDKPCFMQGMCTLSGRELLLSLPCGKNGLELRC